jgi:glycosyltransferase involved in cell wall biosynthesis
MPKVSIITPCYNSQVHEFSRSLESINSQTERDFEWIIVNDGSTDDLGFPVEISLDKNYGPSVARNVGFQIASGEIITYLDMGDELYHDRVENLIKLYSDYQVQLSFAGYNIINPDGELRAFNHFHYIGVSHGAVDWINLFQKQNLSIPMGVSHTRRPFVITGGFQRGIVCGEDGVLWRRMIDNTDPSEIVFTDEIAGNYFVSENGQSRTQRRFEMGGFALDGSRNDNGKYLDESWYSQYSSEEWYE